MTYSRGKNGPSMCRRSFPIEVMYHPSVGSVDMRDTHTGKDGRDEDLGDRNWSICLVLPVYGIIVCLVVWNMHLQTQLALMKSGNYNVSIDNLRYKYADTLLHSDSHIKNSQTRTRILIPLYKEGGFNAEVRHYMGD